MVLFEIHQRFKGHFLSKLRVSFKNNKERELLRATLDNNLNLNIHIKGLCKLATRKLNGLPRTLRLLNLNKRTLIYNSFLQGQFNYCPLIQMFCSRKFNNLINRIHRRALRLCTKNKTFTFNEMLSHTTIHVKSHVSQLNSNLSL